MKKTCLVCNKVWVEGDPVDGLISHGICATELCKALYTVYLLSTQTHSFKEFCRRNRDNMANILHEYRQVA